jgi:hypothetical protein
MGGMDFVQLYEIQRSVFNAEDLAISARFEQLRASVDLFKSLGGGTKLGDDPCVGGGSLPKADERWIQNASKKDSVFGNKPAIGVNSSGQPIVEGTEQVLAEPPVPGIKNVKPN